MIDADPATALLDHDRLEAIAARLDLRQPNKEALESIILAVAQHYEIDREPPPFEAVVDSATGVGKTYILSAAIEYLAADGGRNFAVITPGRTILDKTVANFTAGHPKSLLKSMETRPIVITSENFATAAMRSAMDDPQQVKLFIFTVQALTRPQTTLGRRTHKYQEGLGEAFYAHLQSLDDLVVFADEHHAYYGPAFSKAIRELHPRVLIGLTATPHSKTPLDQIIYRYPLAAAIADRLVKTPVVVGRKDDRDDAATKLLDGVRLLELKERSVARWAQETGAVPVTPLMLVIAQKIDEAEEIQAILQEPSFAGGRYADKVLTVHSNAPDEALAQLDRLEEPGSPYRVVVSVGMLKEGWDVKSVYVIASLRASVSEILTEQTLGRGLRLPFGRYTGVEMLDTLEVLGHERYEQLLLKAGVLNQQFIDHRTRTILRQNAAGQLVVGVETSQVQALLLSNDTAAGAAPVIDDESPARPLISSIEALTAAAEQQLARLEVELPRRPDLPPLRVPLLKMTAVKSDFSLADITDLSTFRQLGERLATDPTGALRRMTLSARIFQGADGLRRAEITRAPAIDHVVSPALLFALDDLRARLLDHVLNASVTPARANQRRPAAEIVDAFLLGLGAQAETILSGYLDRAAAGLIEVVTEQQRHYVARPSYGQVIELVELKPVRRGRSEVSGDRFGPFKKGLGYTGYRKSLYAQDWFDSEPERAVANTLDAEDAITSWVRLQVGDLPILWSTAREYNPDLIAIDRDATHWVVEVKMERERQNADVQGKRDAARRWANHVSADESAAAGTWRYLLVFESDINNAQGSWAALKGAAGAASK